MKLVENAVQAEIGNNERRIGKLFCAEVHFATFLDEVVHPQERDITTKAGRRVLWTD
jgi:hypothetical protein